MVRERDIFPENVGEGSVTVLTLEGSSAVKHFVDENS